MGILLFPIIRQAEHVLGHISVGLCREGVGDDAAVRPGALARTSIMRAAGGRTVIVHSADLDALTLRKAFACFPSGVAALCAVDEAGVPSGITASSFCPVSLQPALVSVCVSHTSTTWPILKQAARVGISVLADIHRAVAVALAAKDRNRFADLEWEQSASGAVFVHGSALWLECTVHDQVAEGDHDIVVFEVEGVTVGPDVAPMVFHGSTYRSLKPLQ